MRRAPEDPKGEIECDFREVAREEELLEREVVEGKNSRREEFRGRLNNTSGRTIRKKLFGTDTGAVLKSNDLTFSKSKVIYSVRPV